jgi:hypothetical protein
VKVAINGFGRIGASPVLGLRLGFQSRSRATAAKKRFLASKKTYTMTTKLTALH